MPVLRPVWSGAAIAVAIVLLAISCQAVADQVAQPIRLASLNTPDARDWMPREATWPSPPADGKDEPFGLSSHLSENSGIARKWREVESKLRADVEIVDRCGVADETCPAAARSFLSIVGVARALEGRARLGAINRAVNLAITPLSDLAQHGVADVWSSPLETFASGRGDCEDYAIAKLAALRAVGMTAADLRLLVVHDSGLGEDHAVVAARLEGRWVILDNRRFTLIDVAHSLYRPLFVLRQRDDGLDPSDVRADWAEGPSGSGGAPILL